MSINVARLGERFRTRLNTEGTDSALRYAVNVMSQYSGCKRLKQELESLMPEGLLVCFRAAMHNVEEKRKIRQQEQLIAQKRVVDEYAAKRNRREESLQNRLESGRAVGMAVAVVSTMTMEERRLSGASKKEIADAVAMRRGAIRASRVREMLECTDTELKRWSEDGRLPVMFRRRMPISVAGKTLDVRHWSLKMVTDAKENIVVWRQEDADARRLRRKRQGSA